MEELHYKRSFVMEELMNVLNTISTFMNVLITFSTFMTFIAFITNDLHWSLLQ